MEEKENKNFLTRFLDKSTDDIVKSYSDLAENVAKTIVTHDLEEVEIPNFLRIKRQSFDFKKDKDEKFNKRIKREIEDNQGYNHLP